MSSATTPCIMVATDIVSDADLVRRLLRDEFTKVMGSTDPACAVQDFEKHRPDVLVLAFNSLEKAERYYLGLYRLGTLVHTLAHRTVILCDKVDLLGVYALCKKQYFNDYVLFWPVPHDAPRLPMAVHQALRQLSASDANTPSAAEFAAQTRALLATQALLEEELHHGGSHLDATSRSLHHARQHIGQALDGFSQQLDVKNSPGLQREIERLKSGPIAHSLDAMAAAVAPVRAWAGSLMEGQARRLESTQALQALADRVRPLVLVVDDDELQHTLLRTLLRDTPIELSFATSGPEALAAVGRRRPDLILMDVDLPVVDGVETTRRIKAVERYAAVPILMITGHGDKDVVVQSYKAGASGFLVKPFNKEVLLAKMGACLPGLPS